MICRTGHLLPPVKQRGRVFYISVISHLDMHVICYAWIALLKVLSRTYRLAFLDLISRLNTGFHVINPDPTTIFCFNFDALVRRIVRIGSNNPPHCSRDRTRHLLSRNRLNINAVMPSAPPVATGAEATVAIPISSPDFSARRWRSCTSAWS